MSLRERGWFIADFEQPAGHRPDFLATYGGGWLLIAARVGAVEDIEKTRRRLARTIAPPGVEARAVVVPDREDGPIERVEGTVEVTTLEQLIARTMTAAGGGSRS